MGCTQDFSTQPCRNRCTKGAKTINIAVCDDLKSDRAALIPIIKDYFVTHSIVPKIFEFESGEALLSSISNCNYDLIFLDIYMNGMIGIEAAKKLKEHSPNCFIIFVSSSSEHGADAFDVDAFHYVIKPVKPEKLFKVLSKWYSLIYDAKTISVKSGRFIKVIAVSEILYIEVFRRSCSIFTTTETVIASMSLSSLEELLPKEDFARPIRYCLVSLRHVSRLNESNLVMDNGANIALSRNEREKMKQAIAAYKLHQLRRR